MVNEAGALNVVKEGEGISVGEMKNVDKSVWRDRCDGRDTRPDPLHPLSPPTQQGFASMGGGVYVFHKHCKRSSFFGLLK